MTLNSTVLHSTVQYCAVISGTGLSRTVLLWRVLPPERARGTILNLRITLQGQSLVEQHQPKGYQWDNNPAIDSKMNNPSSRVFDDNDHCVLSFSVGTLVVCNEEAGGVRAPGHFALW